MSGLDPASLQILMSRLAGVAGEMGAVLRRAAFSPNIKERADCSTALFTADGEMLAQAEHVPVHLGSMPASVRAAIQAVGVVAKAGGSPAGGPSGGPVGGPVGAPAAGGHIVVNDPFAGGTHLNDITLVTPCVVDGTLVGWAANRAHHADVGGSAPGSIPADATEVFEEGLRLPPVRLTDEVRAVLVANSRTPQERLGDLDAQVGANVLGVRRLAELVTGRSAAEVAGGDGGPAVRGSSPTRVSAEDLAEVLDYGERRMRAALAALPDGEWSFEDVVDSFGPAEHQRSPSRIAVTVRLEGERLTFDFTGSDPQRRGNVNTVEAVTVSSVVFAVRSVIAPTLPANGGALRPLTVVAPPGTIVNARPPVAVGAGNVEVSQRIADVCLGALARAVPGGVGAASQGTMNNVLIGGPGEGGRGPWVYYETVGGGQGGRAFARAGAGGATGPGRRELDLRPGQSGIHTAMTNTKNTPIEALERAFPLRVLRQRLRRGSGGAGLAPGGEGIERDLQVLEPCTVSLITERRESRPWGLAGGGPGAPGENWLLPAGDESRAERLPDKCTVELQAGDVLRMLTPGGGGWGRRAD